MSEDSIFARTQAFCLSSEFEKEFQNFARFEWVLNFFLSNISKRSFREHIHLFRDAIDEECDSQEHGHE